MIKSKYHHGFTIPELLVAVVIIAVGSSVLFSVTGAELRREKINSVAIGLTGWLEEIRRSALRGNPCEVTINSNPSGAASGDPIATVSPIGSEDSAIINPTIPAKACQNSIPYQIPDQLSSYKVAVTPIPSASTLQFTFGNLGTVSPLSPTNKEIKLTLISQSGRSERSRCVRIRGMMGFIEIGNYDNGSCVYPSRY